MKVVINLNYNNAYEWISGKDIHVIGYVFYKNKKYIGQELIDLISNINTNELRKFCSVIDGCFSIVIQTKNKIIMISDIMRTFPIFYRIEGTSINIMDNIMKYTNKSLEIDNTIEFLACGYTTSNLTLFKDIYQLEGHQIVTIDKINANIKKEKYFDYKYNFSDKSDDELIDELDELYDRITKK